MSIVFISEVDRLDDWAAEFDANQPGLTIHDPGEIEQRTDVRYALVWNPPAGTLASFPNLRAIFSLGAGVDHILRDPSLPKQVPIVRVVDDNLSMRMAEYVVLHCLMISREQRRLDFQQANRAWVSELPVISSDVRVGLMGLGQLGRHTAERLRDIGFRVAGWSTTRKELIGVESFAGDEELPSFLQRTDILVSLLPHTPKTRKLIDRDVFRQLAKDGSLGGAAFISAGRGTVHVESDILSALDAGDLIAAVLDVFEGEPLPNDSPLWGHPRVTITPHCAAVTDPRSVVTSVLANIARHESGEGLQNVVDMDRGY